MFEGSNVVIKLLSGSFYIPGTIRRNRHALGDSLAGEIDTGVHFVGVPPFPVGIQVQESRLLEAIEVLGLIGALIDVIGNSVAVTVASPANRYPWKGNSLRSWSSTWAIRGSDSANPRAGASS